MRPALAALSVTTAVHLAGQLAAPNSLLTDVTQVLLMPLVAGVLLAGMPRPRGRLVAIVLVALFFSWLGDTLPRFAGDDVGFLMMVGCFLVAQVFYAVAFWRFRDRSILRRPLLLVPYVVGLAVLVVLCREQAGAMLAPIVVYGTALATMSVLATGLGRLGTAGGLIFLLSDSLIAVGAFTDLELPGNGFWVMLTYVAGQLLLVLAVRSQRSRRRSTPAVSLGFQQS